MYQTYVHFVHDQDWQPQIVVGIYIMSNYRFSLQLLFKNLTPRLIITLTNSPITNP